MATGNATKNINLLMEIMVRRLTSRFSLPVSDVAKEMQRIRNDLSCTYIFKSGHKKDVPCGRLLCKQHKQFEDFESKEDVCTTAFHTPPRPLIDLTVPKQEPEHAASKNKKRKRVVGKQWCNDRKRLEKLLEQEIAEIEEQCLADEREMRRIMKLSAMEANVDSTRRRMNKLPLKPVGKFSEECSTCNKNACYKLSDKGYSCEQHQFQCRGCNDRLMLANLEDLDNNLCYRCVHCT